MSFQTFVTERLTVITSLLNAIITNAKKIDELPVQSVLDPTSKIHVSKAGVSESLTVQKILDAISDKSEYNNTFTYTTGSQTFTIPASLKIMSVTLNDGRVLRKVTEWTRTSTTVITILYALDANDTIYITGFN